MEDIEYNKEFNKKLEKGIITKDLLNDLDAAYGYGAASSIFWLISKLKIIKSLIQNKREVQIINDDILVIKSLEEFNNWINTQYESIDIQKI